MADERTLITVHGRAGLVIPYTRWSTVNGVETQVDISAATMFVEIPGARLRKALVRDSNDVLGLKIVLTRTEVGNIPVKPNEMIVLDETGEVPLVDWDALIQRIGYKVAPA
jgi:hypothetical protein